MTDNATDETVEELTFPREVGTTFNADRIVVDEAEYNTLKTLNVLVDEPAPEVDEPADLVPADTKAPAVKTTPPVVPASTSVAAATDNEGGGAK